ncbi:MAG: DUF4398 domain-containing protein [Nitrospirales bacterium]|nr:DUF4398 domain-containing protein [Nitrospirales bacterium]
MTRYCLAFGLALLITGCEDQVIQDIIHLLDSAKSTIEEAKKMGGNIYAPELLGLAESELIISEKELQTQESKVFWRQDFSLALRLAHLAQIDAEKALSKTEEHHSGKPIDLPSSNISPLETLM